MIADPPTLFPEALDQETLTDKGYWCYALKPEWEGKYARWVVQVPLTRGNRFDYESRGFHYLLEEYGQYLITQADGELAQLKNYDARGVPWNSAIEPWRLIFQRGGAKEFPLNQIIAYHWHLVPPYREVTFPQLERLRREGGEIFDFECPECEQLRVFSSPNRSEAATLLRYHLTSRINDQHSYTPADLRALGEELGVDFTTRRVGRLRPAPTVPEPPEPPVAAEVAVQEEAQTDLTEALNLEYQCADCGWAPVITNKQPANALKFHRRAKHGDG